MGKIIGIDIGDANAVAAVAEAALPSAPFHAVHAVIHRIAHHVHPPFLYFGT